MADADGKPLPDTQVPDTQEEFEGSSQVHDLENTVDQRDSNRNRKRTYDMYQDLDVSLARKLDNTFALHAVNAVDSIHKTNAVLIKTMDFAAAQVLKHADVAMDGLWTDELNPVARGAGGAMWGQAPVNSQMAGTASLDTVFTNLTSQVGEQVAQVVGLAKQIVGQVQAQNETMKELLIFLRQPK